MKRPEYHVASFSGGKDSTAMVLHMIERGDHLDEVVFCDTTMEFPAMLRHVEKVKQVVEAAGIKFTTLRADRDFEYYLTAMPILNRKPTSPHFGVPGYGWAGHNSRWCTTSLKTDPINRHLRTLRENYEVIQYIGIAADEDYRLDRKNNQNTSHRHPLREWGWVEDEALKYCYDRGYDWEGLYELKRNPKTGKARVSCWCCPLQSYEDLRTLRQHFPELWEKLLDLDSRQPKDFQHGYSVADFDRRFQLEDVLTEAGHSIKNRAFFKDLNRLLAGEATINDILHERKEGPYGHTTRQGAGHSDRNQSKD
jgi:3'-phosphoadenosine 5'-phosphosulfate sulfotransferase (PAPS reductase)/FAD synthetase